MDFELGALYFLWDNSDEVFVERTNNSSKNGQKVPLRVESKLLMLI
jgi:hypothetical protein